jgi:hypothetical protein
VIQKFLAYCNLGTVQSFKFVSAHDLGAEFNRGSCEFFEFNLSLLSSGDSCRFEVAEYSYVNSDLLNKVEVIVEDHVIPVSTDDFYEFVN